MTAVQRKLGVPGPLPTSDDVPRTEEPLVPAAPRPFDASGEALRARQVRAILVREELAQRRAERATREANVDAGSA